MKKGENKTFSLQAPKDYYQKSIAGIISERTKLTEENVMEMFFRAKTKNPIEAKDIGMVHEIKAVNIPENTKIFSL